MIHLLQRRGAEVTYSDPYVGCLRLESGLEMRSPERIACCRESDCVVIVTDHSCFDYAAMLKAAPLIVDTRNAMRGLRSEKIVPL